MCSLPQGWHSPPIAKQKKMSVSALSQCIPVPKTIRKKWNSPLATETIRSKLPMANNPKKNKTIPNGTIPASNKKASIPQTDSQTESQTSGVSKLVSKSTSEHLKAEITKLKKELSTVKSENSNYKVKVRRVDDENELKSKQIEKLKMELKAANKVESSNNRKGNDSKELLLLRQKCLRLEGALKEKDLALKKLGFESSAKLPATNAKLEASDVNDAKPNEPDKKKTALQNHSNLSRASLPQKSEISKLREIIHKLEKENQELQQQTKFKSEEIRRLKVHIRSYTYIKTPPSTAVKPTLPRIASPVKGESTVPIKAAESKANVSKVKPNAINKKPPVALRNVPPKSTAATKVQGMVKKVDNNPKAVVRKKSQTSDVPPKPKVTKSPLQATIAFGNPTPSKAELTKEKCLEDKAQRIRENLAAKKIQRGWRHHKKQSINKEDEQNDGKKDEQNDGKKDEQNDGKDDEQNVEKFGNTTKETPQNIDKALSFVVTSLKHHKMRKGKLNALLKQKNITKNLDAESHNAVLEAIQAATESIWQNESD